MSEYKNALSELNTQQRKAVETIEGPLLVLAGPGTGKTQLLATRVGYILENTDVLPQNILCLTFTEAGASAMRDRLSRLLGQAAYNVQISTYHAFGSDLLRRYPEYAESYDLEPIDELGSDSLIREILASASYDNPLKSAESYVSDMRQFMDECKRALLKPSEIMKLAESNLKYIKDASDIVSGVLKDLKRVDKSSIRLFDELHHKLDNIPVKSVPHQTSLKKLCLISLAESLNMVDEIGKTTPLTAWKNTWLERNSEGQFILSGTAINKKLLAATQVYSLYQEFLKKRKLFDYNDMIERTIKALQKHPDFKYSLAEQYQYILLDEFQDTNPAQFRLVELLTDNPVNEQRPNIMAVGDDDQAIYAFQGADHANMYRFCKLYRDVRVISLHDNYRSHGDILNVAYSLSAQITERLHESFSGMTKILKQSAKDQPAAATIVHAKLESDASQYAWIAEQIDDLVKKQGIPMSEIAVLAPKHRYLIPLLPYLAAKGVPVRYEKRENILDKPILVQLEQMSRLVLALANRDQGKIDSLWPQILSYDFWNLPTEEIWRLSWQAYKDRLDWTDHLLQQDTTKNIALFFLRLKDLLNTTTLEEQLDLLTGVTPTDTKEYKLPMRCPLFEFYFGKSKDAKYMETLNDLSVIRGRLRSNNKTTDRAFGLADFIALVDAHRSSKINILNTSPHYEAKEAVNIMSAYQAKGREFKAVFVLALQDEVWGSASRSNKNNIGLPPNLSYIRYRGESDDERLRLLYVAITRAKTHLFLSSYTSTVDGKSTTELKYLTDQPALAAIAPHNLKNDIGPEEMHNYWHQRHIPPLSPQLKYLLEPVLASYQLSPTHLNQFIDVERMGPEEFFLNSILRFPKRQTPSAAFGSAVHDTLNWLHTQIQSGINVSENSVLNFFDNCLLRQRLAELDFILLKERGHTCIPYFLTEANKYTSKHDRSETNFKSEGVFIGKAHISGKIDRILVNPKTKRITVVDFKTGKYENTWRSTKMHKYRQQLLMYKLLVEGSHSYKGYTVDRGVLVFVEPIDGHISSLETEFKQEELDHIKELIQSVWNHIQLLNMPNVSHYTKNLAGIKKFEQDLITQHLSQ